VKTEKANRTYPVSKRPRSFLIPVLSLRKNLIKSRVIILANDLFKALIKSFHWIAEKAGSQ
jgi:hypothetical protein